MKLKRTAAFTLALLIAVLACLSAFLCSAAVTTSSGMITALPGNTRSLSPDYSYAWLDTVVVRDDAMAFIPSEMEPLDEYPYSKTLDEFISETSQYMVLFALNSTSVTDIFLQMTDVFYYAVTVLGLTADESVMRDYLTEYGIDLTTENDDRLTKTYMSIVYACIKSNAFYLIYNKNVSIPKGATLEHAMVIILANGLDIELPSSVTSLTGLTHLVMRGYITDAGINLPISENPDAAESEYLAKIAVATARGYTVPLVPYADALESEKEYVNYAYCAAMIKGSYDITIQPAALCDAMNSSEENAVQRLMLSTMLAQSGVAVDQDAEISVLFNEACKAGWFDLDKEFFTDIFEYNVNVPYDCEKVWLSPFSLCEELNYGSMEYLKLTINGVETSNGAAVGVPIDISKQKQSVVIRSSYDDGTARADKVDYVFNFIRLSPEETTTNKVSGSGIIGAIEGYIQSALPEENTGAQEVVGSVFSAIDSVAGNDATGVLSTYSYETTDGSQSATDSQNDSSARFTTFADDTETTEELVLFEDVGKEAEPIVNAFFSLISNNKAAATATPVSLLALSVAAGLLANKRRKGNDSEDTDDQSIDTDF